jgi:hypothetical protein
MKEVLIEIPFEVFICSYHTYFKKRKHLEDEFDDIEKK